MVLFVLEVSRKNRKNLLNFQIVYDGKTFLKTLKHLYLNSIDLDDSAIAHIVQFPLETLELGYPKNESNKLITNKSINSLISDDFTTLKHLRLENIENLTGL